MMGGKDRSDNHGVSSFALYFLVASVIIFGIVTFHFLAGGNVQTGYSNFATALSGLTLPLIGIGAALITYLAFRMQYEANIKIQKQIQLQERQFKLQQFESQFYELLRLHKENVNEMVIQGYVYEDGKKIEREIIGRKIFVSNVTEFMSLVKIIKGYVNHKRDKKELLFNIRDKYIITIAYHIFFFGLDSFERQVKTNKHPVTKENLSAKDKGCLKEMVKCLRAFRKLHKDFGDKEPICTMIPNVKLYFNYKPYSGHLSRYGHYYRNLILIVKHVVDNRELGLTYAKKREYLRILRAQLTSHEQYLLFLNWYSGIGTQWEEDGIEGNRFFTDYRMIHNINADVIEDSTFNWEGIIGSKFEKRLGFKYLNERDKELFEVIGGFVSIQNNKTT